MFKFQHSQIKQKKFEQLADYLLKHSVVYDTPKFDVRKIQSPLHSSLKRDAASIKQHAFKVPIYLQGKVNRLTR